LSHTIVDIFKGSGFINFHGHIHNLESGISNCINVSVEKTGYKPVLLESLVSGYEEMNELQRGENGIEMTIGGNNDITR
jgi:calcineurin-like phosphoesterase family protein